MRSPIFDEGVAPPGFEGFHFKIRGWHADKNAEHFNEFMRKTAKNTQVVATRLVQEETGVAFIKLERGSKGKSDLLGRIGRLCWDIVDPDNRPHVNRLTDRSLLGFVPLTGEVQSLWSDALFKTAMKEGSKYLQEVHNKENGDTRLDFVPSWAAVLAFAMVSEINLAGYQIDPPATTASTTTASTTSRSTTSPIKTGFDGSTTNRYTKTSTTTPIKTGFDGSTTDRYTKTSTTTTSKSGFDGNTTDGSDGETASLFFDEDALKIGGDFLRALVHAHRGSDFRSVKKIYSDGVRDLEAAIQVIFESFGDLINSRRDKNELSQCCKQAKNACYSATLRAAMATLANKTIFEEFLDFRFEQSTSTDLSVEIAALGLLSTAAVSSSFAPVSASASVLWTVITTWSWPTALAVTNPFAGAVVGLASLALLIASRHNASSRAEDILYHQRLIILISRCCSVTNTIVVLMECIEYLEVAGDLDIPAILGRIDNEDLLKRWNEFVDTNPRGNENRSPSQRKKSYRHKRGLDEKQKQVRRFMKWLAHRERKCLANALETLQRTGELDEPSNSESEGEPTE